MLGGERREVDGRCTWFEIPMCRLYIHRQKGSDDIHQSKNGGTQAYNLNTGSQYNKEPTAPNPEHYVIHNIHTLGRTKF